METATRNRIQTEKQFVDMLAKICYYAQDFFYEEVFESGSDAEGCNIIYEMMEATSYTVACFLGQNTKKGENGVCWEVVHSDLCYKKLNLEGWNKIIAKHVKKLGGLK